MKQTIIDKRQPLARRLISFSTALIMLATLFLLSGCFGKVEKQVVNYYVLDYQKSGEKPELRRPVNTGKMLEVFDTNVAKTYDRTQIVVKENFYRVRYLQNDVWATKLRDAIPSLIVQRMRAYNIFGQVTRGEILDRSPQFFLETNVFNIEKIQGNEPKAYLRMEFVLRDSTQQKILLTHRSESNTALTDASMVFLVQAFNEMIMEETNVFAAKCNLFFSGMPILDTAPEANASHLENYIYERMAQSSAQIAYGELSVKTKTDTEEQIHYIIEGLDSLNTVISKNEEEMNRVITLLPGRYRVTLGESGDIVIPVEIKPKQRAVLSPNWGELQVVILDESQSRVRMGYDIWVKNVDSFGYKTYSGGMFSMGDDEIGSVDKLWILPKGHYLIKLGGGSWSDLRNFATVPIANGDRKTLTMVVDPFGEINFLIGAGVFADDDLGYGSKRWHKGALHANLSLSSNNNVDKNKPSISSNLSAQFDNSIDTRQQIRPFHFTMRSIYDLGINLTTGKDIRFNLDDYSLKSVLLLYPYKTNAFLKNFAFYGRADQTSHFFDERLYFTENKNYIQYDEDGIEVFRSYDQSDLRTKIAFYPLRLKEGTGLTYRLNLGTNSWMSIRGGYGWQQDLNKLSYIYTSTGSETVNGVSYSFDKYNEEPDRISEGIESTVILSAINILKVISINSTLDVLFPMSSVENNYRLENENRINFRLFRNISVDVKVKIEYDRAVKPWVIYDYTSFLRLSLFY